MLDNLTQEPSENPASEELLQEPTSESLQQEEDLAEPAEAEVPESEESAEYYLIGDEEVPVKTVEEWRNGHMMQQDYTRKTQEVSEERKAIKAEKDSINAKASEVSALIDEFEAELNKESEGIDWDELWDTSPAEARKKERDIKARKERISEARQKAATAKQEVSQDFVREEQSKLFAAKPEWVKDGNVTESFTKDTEAIGSYLTSVGYNADEASRITDHRVLLMALDAARYKASKTKAVDLEKKVANAPRVSRPRKGTSSVELQLQQAQKELKATGTDAAYMKVQNLKKQLKR